MIDFFDFNHSFNKTNLSHFTMKQSLLRCIFLTVSLFSLCGTSRASHVIGGEMTYRFLSRDSLTGTNRYQFTLRIYVDCVRADTNTFALLLNNRANISIFEGSNIYPLRIVAVPYESNVGVPQPANPCFARVPDVCVRAFTLSWQLTLPPSSEIYTISFGTCCRNFTISNINNASSTGAVFTTQITPAAFAARSSSPAFNSFPPIVICAGEALNFDHSATDADGDQLVYEFIAPLAKGVTSSGNFFNADPPPYLPVNFTLPAYSGTAPINGNPTVRIDPNTGQITGTPIITGQFVVGVRVSEYRNGILLSTVSRDFQFNVKRCVSALAINLVADSVSDKVYFISACSAPTTLTLRNNSINNAPVQTFEWLLKYPNDSIYRFYERSPTITFRDTGYYVGKMYLNRATGCSDSCEVRINIGSGAVSDFKFLYDTCVVGAVAFTDLSRKGYYPLRRWQWDFGDGTRLDTPRSSNPIRQYRTAGIKTVRLTLTDQFACQTTIAKTFAWQPAPPIVIAEPSAFQGCAPAQVSFINRSTPADSTYRNVWDFGDGTSTVAFSPQHQYTQAGVYTVRLTITSPLNCRKTATFTDWTRIRPVPKANFYWEESIITNLNTPMGVHFRDSSSSDVRTWRWFFNDKNYSAEKNPTFRFGRDTGFQSVSLAVFNQFGCTDSLRKRLYIQPTVTFFMPNAFTPNDDAVNDVFKGTGFTYGLRAFSLTVWARWGEQLYLTTNPNDGWNGRNNNVGEPLPEGTYLYQLRYVAPTGEQIEKRDWLNLFR